MGRIHRYGQRDDVRVYNLVAQNTREGAVLQTVLHKLDVMRDQMGSDRVYDVIDDWLEGVPLVNLMEKAIDSEMPPKRVKKPKKDSVRLRKSAPNIWLRFKRKALWRLALISGRPETCVTLPMREGFNHYSFNASSRGHGLLAAEPFAKTSIFPFGTLVPRLSRSWTWPVQRISIKDRYDTPFVFDKQLVSVASKIKVPDRTKLLGPGHVLFDALIKWAIRESRQAFAKGTYLVDPNLASPQRLWLVRSTIQDGRLEDRKRLAHERLTVIAADHMGLRSTSPSYLLNCLAPEDSVEPPVAPDHSMEEIQTWAYEEITEKQLTHVMAGRQEECKVRREYLETAFTDLILELQEDLSELQHTSLFGDDDAEDRERLHKRIEELKARKVERMKELDLMLNLTANLPDILTEAIVIPAPAAVVESTTTKPPRGFPMQRDAEIEAIAMDLAMRYERSRGWTPFDVHADGEHYDVRSESPNGEKRFIEVKGRAQSGAIVLTGPELDKLRQLSSRAWLYIATFCKGEKPRLRIIQDPIPKLNPEMLYRQVQFMVEESDWAGKGEEVGGIA
jgi:Domain of unknown function (DUF3883)